MLQDIKQHIDLVDGSIAWAKEFGKESFPYDVFKEYRRKLKRIYAALEENCSAAAYGESQVGKSYLMSSLLSSPNSPFVITNAGKSYSFIDDINPSGGNNAKIESTGVITRFTLSQGCSTMSDFVKVRNLSVVDIILLLADSYYNDIKINQDSVLRYDDINKALEDMNGLWASKIVVQNEIDEDDVKDITDYIHDVIGNAATGVNQSNFCKIVAPVIQYVSGYKPDTFIAIYPTLQRRNAPSGNIFKNAAVYLADRLTENYCHRLKVRFVCQQSQMVQRAELLRLASPCPIFRVQIIAPLLQLIKMHFHVYIILVFLDILDNACCHHARKNTLATLADKLLVYFCRFHTLKIYLLLPCSFFSIHLSRLWRHSASVLATVENSSPSVWR